MFRVLSVVGDLQARLRGTMRSDWSIALPTEGLNDISMTLLIDLQNSFVFG